MESLHQVMGRLLQETEREEEDEQGDVPHPEAATGEEGSDQAVVIQLNPGRQENKEENEDKENSDSGDESDSTEDSEIEDLVSEEERGGGGASAEGRGEGKAERKNEKEKAPSP